MPRTSLFSDLQRALRKACWARRDGPMTAAQREERWQALRLNRRQFLQRSMGVAALAGLPLGCHSDDDDDNRRLAEAGIAIIGTGLAGLHCAFRLQQAGVGARLFDASTRTGGRILSGRNIFPDGKVVELGAEFIDSNHACMQMLAEEFGLQLDDRLANERPGFEPETYFFDNRLVSVDEIVELFEPIAMRILASAAAAEESDEAFDRLDAMSITEWLVDNGVDPLLQSILEVAYTSEFRLEADTQSVFNLFCLIDAEVLNPFRIIGESDERFRVNEGNDRIPAILAERLESEIEREARLVAVTELSDGRFRLTFVRSAGQVFETMAERVVFALPFNLLRQVVLNVSILDDKLLAINEIGYGVNSKLSGGFTTPVWHDQFNARGDVFADNGLVTAFDGGAGQPGSTGVYTRYTGGLEGINAGRGTAEEQMLAALPLLDQIFPDISTSYVPGSAVRMHWPAAPFAQGSYMCPLPGQTGLLEVMRRREGNLHFCGEHTSIDFFGFMEGAAESGAFVADAILGDLGIPQPAALRRMIASNLGTPRGSMRGDRLRRVLGLPARF